MDSRTVAGKTVRRPVLDAEDLASSDLSLTGRFNYDECLAEDIDQDGAEGQGSLHRVAVLRSSLSESQLKELELMDVALRNVVLANARWEKVSARRVEVLNCQAIGVQLAIVKAEDLYVEDCKFDYARLGVEQRRGPIVFHRCTFVEAVLEGDLSEIVFSECEFRGAEFRARRATNCDMTRSRLVGASGLLSLAGTMITDDQAMTLSGQFATEVGFVIAAEGDSSAGKRWGHT